MNHTVETTDLYLEELGQLFKDYEAVKNARITVANIQGIVELEAATKQKIVAYLSMYSFPESNELKEKEKRIAQLEEALNGIVRIKDIIVPDDELVTDENAGEAEAIYKAFSKIESLLNKTN